jgi:hypothetical protein
VIRLLTGGLPAFARQRISLSSSASYGEVSPQLRNPARAIGCEAKADRFESYLRSHPFNGFSYRVEVDVRTDSQAPRPSLRRAPNLLRLKDRWELPRLAWPVEAPGVETPALSSCVVVDDDAIVVVVDRRSQPMAQITINEGLAWLKTLKKRHEELLALRNDNAHRERRFYGASADREIVKEPVYDVKALDKIVTRIAREIRLLDQALKTTNAKTVVERYEQDDTVLGELA